MRTITAAQEAVLASGVQSEHVRVLVEDAGAELRDLSDYPGFNATTAVSWRERVADEHASCELQVKREFFQLNMAPLMANSALNRSFDPGATYAPFLALNRQVVVQVAIVPIDAKPETGDWMTVFHGRIDNIDAASGPDISISCRALSGRLAQQFIKTERVYSFASVDSHSVSLRIWAPQIDVKSGEYLVPATRGEDDPGYQKFFKCTTDGTTGTSEPTWSTGTGITDGTTEWDYEGTTSSAGNPVEEIMQNLLDDHRGPGDEFVMLVTPTSPLWDIKEYLQQRQPTWTALRALATQIGWDLRYKWSDSEEEFQLTFYDPDREVSSPMFTFGPNDYGTPDRLAIDISEIRNSCRVIYSDALDLWPDSIPKRKVVEISNLESIVKYGELFCEMQEEDTSQIDSVTEASRLANACLSDCAEPTAELSVPLMRAFPWFEVNDFVRFGANATHFDADQDLAVVGWQQTFENGRLRTRVECRGKPTIGANRYISRSSHPAIPKKGKGHQLQDLGNSKTPKVNIKSAIGGTAIELTGLLVDKNSQPQEYEHHVYTVSGASLDGSTLYTTTKARDLTIADLVPGEEYFHRVVVKGTNAERPFRSEPTVEKSFTAGRAATAHLDAEPEWGRRPLNGGFETRTNPDPNAVPDHWNVIDGDPPFVVETDSRSGNRALRLSPDGGDFHTLSDRFVVTPGTYCASWWINHDGGTGEVQLYVVFYDIDGTETGTLGIDTASTDNVPTDSEWFHRGDTFEITAGDPARYAAIGFQYVSDGDIEVLVDEVTFERVPHEDVPAVEEGASRTTTSSDFATMFSVITKQTMPGHRITVHVATSLFSTDADTGLALRVVANYPDGHTEASGETRFLISDADKHVCVGYHATVDGWVQAGDVTMELQWRRYTGSGTLTQNGDDYTSVVAGE